ncbi:MAG TPA: tetratricopeptide repeat protein, partial [Kofleriaceae bacterium]
MRRKTLGIALVIGLLPGLGLAAPHRGAKVVDTRKLDRGAENRLGDAFRAYDSGDLDTATKLVAKLDPQTLVAKDYALWLRGMVALRTGDPKSARTAFEQLGKISGSRFAPQVPWRLADCTWETDRPTAARQYDRLLSTTEGDTGDLGTAMYRIAEVAQKPEAYRRLLLAHPSHPLATDAEAKMLALGGAPLSPADRVERAKQLTTAHLWDQAISELALVPKDSPVATQRDYWLGTTLFEMRRRYGDAGQLLLGVYQKPDSAEAMFHGARALSRADRDDEAITWYHKVVAAYPSTAYAQEAQFLSGWLEFNRGHYQAAVKPLEDSLAKYPHSKWV